MKSKLIQGVPIPTITDDYLKKAKMLIYLAGLSLRSPAEGSTPEQNEADMAAARRLKVPEMMLVIEALVAAHQGHNND